MAFAGTALDFRAPRWCNIHLDRVDLVRQVVDAGRDQGAIASALAKLVAKLADPGDTPGYRDIRRADHYERKRLGLRFSSHGAPHRIDAGNDVRRAGGRRRSHVRELFQLAELRPGAWHWPWWRQ